MVVCIVAFRTPVSVLGGVGSAIAILGSYVYAMAKTAEAEQKKLEAEQKAAGGIVVESSKAPPGKDSGKHPLLPLMMLMGKTGLCD